MFCFHIYRGRRNTYHHTSLVKVDGVNDVEGGNFYIGKKIAYIYKAPTAVKGSKFRYVWGKVTRTHGANGVLRAKFATNLNVSSVICLLFFSLKSSEYNAVSLLVLSSLQPEWIGNSVRVMLYPSRI